MPKINIAIDGFSACGKSTLAKALSEALGYIYIDTGAMYRAVTMYLIDNHIDIEDKKAVEAALPKITIRFARLPEGNHTLLNGTDIERQIRTLVISSLVSEVSAISSVRRFLVAQQRDMAAEGGVVMDGRDIGTVVLPDATLKLFLTASPEVRAHRRWLELKNKDQETTLDQVAHNLSHRDHIDSTRADSPLRRADDAILIDNSELTEQSQLCLVLDMAHARKIGVTT